LYINTFCVRVDNDEIEILVLTDIILIKKTQKIKAILERLYVRYNHRRLIKPDPLQYVYKYCNRADMEIAGLLSAILAYGRVGQIEKKLAELFFRMQERPFEFVRNFDEQGREKLKSFKHRFTKGDDISDLLVLLKTVLTQHNTIEKYFVQGYKSSDENIIPAMSKFCDSLLHIYSVKFGRAPGRGLKYLLASPVGGSACKRMNLFLRWMVRSDDVDTGLWASIDKAKLLVPVDVHMGRLCRILGFYSLNTVSLKAVVEITDSFAEIVPDDPVKYDFALSRIGIVEDCDGKYRPQCDNCELAGFCTVKIR